MSLGLIMKPKIIRAFIPPKFVKSLPISKNSFLGWFSESHPIPNADVAITSLVYLVNRSFISTARILPSKTQKKYKEVRFQVLMVASQKVPVEVIQHFTGPCSLHHSLDVGGSKHL
jgi:hypothetical protein